MAVRWEKYPFVRLVIPLVAGISVGELCPNKWFVYVLWLMAVCAFFLILSYWKGRNLFGVVLSLLLFVGGGANQLYQKQKVEVKWPQAKALYQGRVVDTPQEKPHSYWLPVEVQGKEVYLYLAKDSLAEPLHATALVRDTDGCKALVMLKRGESIRFYARITALQSQSVPGQFDYMRYLKRKGVTGRAYVASGYWEPIATEAKPSLRQRALEVRDRLLKHYRTLGFRGEELAVLSALTLGDKSGLSDAVKETYSITGASHVLALSGLHIGILYSIVWFLLSFLHFGKYTSGVRMALLLGALWSFAFVVGLSTSVVRSACMFSLFAVAHSLGRRSLSLNTLALSAFLMLLYQPNYLFDVGFQLSFAAVLSIICFYPIVFAWWNPTHRVFRYVWGILAISLAVQLGVAPLILYYFSRFSVYFLLTNLLVIPLTFCWVGGTLLMLACGFYFPLQKGVALCLMWGIKGMNGCLEWIGNLPCSAIDVMHVNGWGIWAFYLFLLFALLFYGHKRASYLLGMLGSATCMLALWCYSLLNPQPARMLFSHAKQGLSVQCAYTGGVPFELFSHTDDVGLQRFKGKYIVLVKDNRWARKYANLPLEVDYLCIQKGFTGRIAELQSLFKVARVVLDTSVSASMQERLRKECQELNIPLFALSEEGYLWVNV